MIKVAHIVECAGGVDAYLRMLTPRLKSRGVNQLLICSSNYNPAEYEGKVDGIQRVEIVQSFNPVRIVSSVKNVRNILRHYNPDLVYCHSSFAGVVGRLASLWLGVKVVYNPHGWSFDMRCSCIKRGIYSVIERIFSHVTDAIVAISYAEKIAAVSRHVAPALKVHVIYNGIELGDRMSSRIKYRKDLGIPDSAFVVGMVGRISDQKAPDTFVRAASLIIKKIPEAWFVIVGDGEARNQVQQLANNLGIGERLVITGWISDVSSYIKMFDQAMLLSRWEGFGLVLAEYMREKKPIIATNVGAINEIVVHNHNGLLVNVDDSNMVSQSVYYLYTHELERSRFVSVGFERVKTLFDIERVALQHKSLFEEIVNS